MLKMMKKALELISGEGFGAFLKKVASKLGYFILNVRKLIIYEKDLLKQNEHMKATIDLSFKFASIGAIEALNDTEYDYDPAAKKYLFERMAKGDKCLLALAGKKIIAYYWVMMENMELSQKKHLPLPKNKGYLYKAFVLKEFRGKRVINEMHCIYFDELRSIGIKTIYTWVPSYNKPSIKTSERIGFEKIGNIYQIRLFSREYIYIRERVLQVLQKD